MALDLSILLRLIVAIVLAGILGWERERAGKSAGIRTHMLVGLSAALFVVLGELFILRFRDNDLLRFDPIRIVEAVVTGISFLGAGTIFVAKEKEEKVQGLTTAAAILATAAIGLIVGLERYFLATAATLIIFVVLYSINFIEFKDKKPESQSE